MRPGSGMTSLACLSLLLLSACDNMPTVPDDRPEAARAFPKADRPVAPIISTRWASEEMRDRRHEAEDIMTAVAVTPGMTVADIGAGEGYYTVRLARRVGPHGRVLAEDIVAEVIDALGHRVTRENWANVSVKLGTPENPKLPANSFDRVFMVHMYHEIAEPYAFLWNLHPALKDKGEVVIVESNRPTSDHGTPPELLKCEMEAIGYVQLSLVTLPSIDGYLARFARATGKAVRPDQIIPCRIRRPDSPDSKAGPKHDA